MAQQLRHKTPLDSDGSPVEFIVICAVAFTLGTAATVYFCRSMSGNMNMPGGWKMSMMWMRMPGQTWFTSILSFLLVWLSMMVAMMIPSALPAFLRTRQKQCAPLCYTAGGYFAVWLTAGIGIYALGMSIATFAMQSELLSRAMPFLSGTLLVTAGVIQFTRWKKSRLLCCRSPFGCSVSLTRGKTGFQLGCNQGVACFLCCISPMAIMLTFGMMNPLVMIVVAMIIAAEKMLPRPEVTSHLVGLASILAGTITIVTSSGL